MSHRAWSQSPGWSAAERKQAELGAGRAGDPTIYDGMSKAEIRAEYDAAKEYDAWTAQEMERQFPWLKEA